MDCLRLVYELLRILVPTGALRTPHTYSMISNLLLYPPVDLADVADVSFPTGFVGVDVLILFTVNLS